MEARFVCLSTCSDTGPNNLLERLKLLPHILQYTNKISKVADFSLKKLIKSTDGINLDTERKKHWKPEYLERLNEIYRVRAKEMQYQKEEIGDCHSSWRRFLRCADTTLDGDTLVHVHVPKPRGNPRKPRKPRKSAAKTAKPSSKRGRNEPEERNSSVRKAPVANMGINPQITDPNMGQNEMSRPSNHTGTSALTEEVTPEVSCCEPTLCNGHDASTMLGSQPRQDRSQKSVEENWTMRSTNYRQDQAVSTNPPSSMQTSYSQFGRQQNGQGAWQQVPSQTRVNETLARSAPAHLVTPEVEVVRYPGFAASSSGLVGYSGWQGEEYLNPQGTSSVYTDNAAPNPSLLPYTYGSFSNDHSYSNPSSGPRFGTWNNESQTVTSPYGQSLDGEQQQRFGTPAVGYSPYSYQHLGMATPSAGNRDLANQSLQHNNSGIGNSSSGVEHQFYPYSQDRRQL